jgi:hypothetical protein
MSESKKDLGEVADVLERLERKIERVLLSPRKVFTFEEAAEEVLGISPQTLNRLVACGAVRPIVIGKRRFISAKELDRIAEEGAPLEEMQGRKPRTPRTSRAALTEAEKVLAALKKP